MAEENEIIVMCRKELRPKTCIKKNCRCSKACLGCCGLFLYVRDTEVYY